MPIDSDSKKPDTGVATPAPRGETAFAAFDYAIKVAKVGIVVLGIEIIIIALSGVDMARLDEHEIFQYRMVAAPALIVVFLLVDYLFGRRRARQTAETPVALHATVVAGDEFVLSIDPDAHRNDTTVAATSRNNLERTRRGFAAEFIALALVAAGGAAFWHDNMTHDFPNPVAVTGKFVSAACFERPGRSIVVVGPYMAIGYEFPSQSTQPRPTQVTCLLEKCEPQQVPGQMLDIEYNKVPYLTMQACRAALPAILAAAAPTTVWTGDKDPNATVRARFTPERHAPPYFLLWIPLLIAAVILPVSVFLRRRKWTESQGPAR